MLYYYATILKYYIWEKIENLNFLSAVKQN